MAQPHPSDEGRRVPGPARDSDTDRAIANVASRLRDREIHLTGRETSEQLVDMLTAVEAFEAAVAELGGDSMSNSPDSEDPEEPRFVLPRRAADDSPSRYTTRVREAARRLASRAD